MTDTPATDWAHPVSELVAAIRKDLGLDPDWPTLAQEAWAREEMAEGNLEWPWLLHAAHPGEGRDPDREAPGFRTPRTSRG